LRDSAVTVDIARPRDSRRRWTRPQALIDCAV